MGKSLKNVVTPDDMYAEYGADTLRVYEMSMGPLDLSRPWETRAVVGSQRFLQRLWRNVVDEGTGAIVVSDEAPVRRDAAGAAPHDRGRHGGHGGDADQHRDRQAHRAQQPPDDAADDAPRGGRAARAHDRAGRAARRRGAVVAAGPRRARSRTSRSRWPTRRTWSRTRSPASSRCRARSAAASRSPPDVSDDDLRELALADVGRAARARRARHPHRDRPGAQARQRRPGLSRCPADARPSSRRSRSSPTRRPRCPRARPSGGASGSSRWTSSSTARGTSRAST